MRRKPRTAAQLMPMPRRVVEQLYMQQHCALAAFSAGKASMEQFPILARIVYLPFIMGRAEYGRHVDAAPYRIAEAMLQRCMLRGQAGQGWALDASEAACFAGLLAHLDAHLAACRQHVYDEAITAMNRAEMASRSPLVEHDAPPEHSAFFRSFMALVGSPYASS